MSINQVNWLGVKQLIYRTLSSWFASTWRLYSASSLCLHWSQFEQIASPDRCKACCSLETICKQNSISKSIDELEWISNLLTAAPDGRLPVLHRICPVWRDLSIEVCRRTCVDPVWPLLCSFPRTAPTASIWNDKAPCRRRCSNRRWRVQQHVAVLPMLFSSVPALFCRIIVFENNIK